MTAENNNKDTKQFIELSLTKRKIMADMCVEEIVVEASGEDSGDALNNVYHLIQMLKHELNTHDLKK